MKPANFQNGYLGILAGEELNAAINGASLSQVTVSLTSAQILSMKSAPVLVVPAPPSGFIAVVISVVYLCTVGTTQYVGDGGGLYYGNDNVGPNTLADTGDGQVFNVGGGIGARNIVTASNAAAFADLYSATDMLGTALYYSTANTAYTLGDGTGIINVLYYFLAI